MMNWENNATFTFWIIRKILLHFYFKSSFFKKKFDLDRKRSLNLKWSSQFRYPIHWELPKTLNEKIQWLQVNSDTNLWTKYADKYEVRLHLESLGLANYLPLFWGVWDSPEDINLNTLPQKFVLKCTHDCQSTLLIDRQGFDNQASMPNSIIGYFKKKTRKRYGYITCEPHYTRIKPRLIAEEWLPNTKRDISTSLIDYKMWCFNGLPSYIMTIHNRKGNKMQMNLYDLEWNLRNDLLQFGNHYLDGKGEVPKPDSLNEMIKVASILSEGFPQVRVDFYDIKGKLYFGEMTFTSGCGRMTYFTDKAQLLFGQLIKLPGE